MCFQVRFHHYPCVLLVPPHAVQWGLLWSLALCLCCLSLLKGLDSLLLSSLTPGSPSAHLFLPCLDITEYFFSSEVPFSFPGFSTNLPCFCQGWGYDLCFSSSKFSCLFPCDSTDPTYPSCICQAPFGPVTM